MGCFSLAWVIQTLIWLVVIGAIVAIIRVVLPLILELFGFAGDIAMRVFNIILLAVVIIAVLYLCLDLLSCVSLGRVR